MLMENVFYTAESKIQSKTALLLFNPIFSSQTPLFLWFDRPFSLNNHIFSRGLIFRHICQLWFLSIVKWTENVILHGCIKVQYKSVKAFFKPDKTLPKSWAWHRTRNFFIHFCPFFKTLELVQLVSMSFKFKPKNGVWVWLPVDKHFRVHSSFEKLCSLVRFAIIYT